MFEQLDQQRPKMLLNRGWSTGTSPSAKGDLGQLLVGLRLGRPDWEAMMFLLRDLGKAGGELGGSGLSSKAPSKSTLTELIHNRTREPSEEWSCIYLSEFPGRNWPSSMTGRVVLSICLLLNLPLLVPKELTVEDGGSTAIADPMMLCEKSWESPQQLMIWEH